MIERRRLFAVVMCVLCVLSLCPIRIWANEESNVQYLDMNTVLDGEMEVAICHNDQPIDEQIELEPNDKLQVSVRFKFREDESITDRLNWQFRLPEYFKDLGLSYYETHKAEGQDGHKADYEIQDNVLKIRFNKGWVNNGHHSQVKGTFAFDLEFQNDKTNHDKDITIQTPDKVYTIKVLPRPVEVHPRKKNIVKIENNVVFYEYHFTPLEETSRLELDDTLGSNLELIKDSVKFDGENVIVDEKENGFTYKPGVVDAREHVLTYQAAITNPLDVSNSGTVTIRDTGNRMELKGALPIPKDDGIQKTPDITYKRIQKSGELVDDHIVWKVTMNDHSSKNGEIKADIDLSGKEVIDQVTNAELKDRIVKCVIDGTETRDFEFEPFGENRYRLVFPEDIGTKSVELIYNTTIGEALAVGNEVSLKHGETELAKSVAQVKTGNTEEITVEKNITSQMDGDVIKSDDGVVRWEVVAHVPNKIEKIEIEDGINANAGTGRNAKIKYTPESIHVYIKEKGKDFEEVSVNPEIDGKYLTLCLEKPLKDFDLRIVYETVDDKSVADYNNEVKLTFGTESESFEKTASKTYKRIQETGDIMKSFMGTKSKEDGPLKQRLYKWRIVANRNVHVEKAFEDLTGKEVEIIEHIPEGMVFDSVDAFGHKVAVTYYDENNNVVQNKEDARHVSFKMNDYTTRDSLVSLDVVCKPIPEFDYVKLSNSLKDDGYSNDFSGFEATFNISNRAEYKLGGTVQSDSLSNADLKIPVLKKKGVLDPNTGLMNYTLEVNEAEAVLIAGDDVTIVDTLDVHTEYVIKSLNVFSVTDKKDITGDCTFELKQVDDNQVLEIKIPNKKHCRIEYKTTLNGAYGTTYDTVTNKVRIEGIDHSHDNEKTNLVVAKPKSTIEATASEVTVNKYDTKQKPLGGAIFTLYEVNEDDGTVKNGVTATTNEQGQAKFESLKPNELYKLVETEAPNGYKLVKKPRYILLADKDNPKYQAKVEKIKQKDWYKNPKETTTGKKLKPPVLESRTTFTFINKKKKDKSKFKVTKITISGTKTWIDEGNKDGMRPESIKVKLMNGENVVREQEVTEATGWRYEFKDLPKTKDGKLIEYSVKEDDVRCYVAEYDGTNIRNVYRPERTTKNGKKIWDDHSNQDGKRPKSVHLKLYKVVKGIKTPVAEKELNGQGDSWDYQFDNLLKYEQKEEIQYVVEEDSVDGYTTTIDGFKITNTHEPELTNITGTKTWADANNQDGIRPEKITVVLFGDKTEVNRKDVTAANGWKYEFVNLPKYKDGKEIDYTIEEEPVDGYETVVKGNDITNTHVPETTTIEGTKTWDDANNQDGVRPEKITVVLMDGETEVAKTDVTALNGWKYEFSGLPKNRNGKAITYSVKEEDVEGYTSKVKDYDITNTHVPETTTIEGTKTWDDANNQDGVRPEKITVVLMDGKTEVAKTDVTAANSWKYEFINLPKYRDGKEIDYTIQEEHVDGYETVVKGNDITNTHIPELTKITGTKTWDDANDQDGIRPEKITVMLMDGDTEVARTDVTEANGWKYEFSGLPKNRNGKAIAYSVKEEDVEGYTSKINDYDITNTHVPETTTIEGTKTWNDANNQDGVRPEKITVMLMDGDTEVARTDVAAANGWKYEFSDLPKNRNGKAITYSVKEEDVEGYTSKIKDYDITNTHVPETTTIEGTKTWNDANNQDGVRPEKITVMLMDGDTEVARTDVTALNGWKYEFIGLPKNRNGKAIRYSVKELKVNGYTSSTKGYDITNTHVPETTTIEGTKTWKNENNQDGIRPEKITVMLMDGNTEVARTDVTATNGWKYEFKDLPKKRKGKAIAYSVKEEDVVGYTSKIKDYDITNTHVPETTTIEGTKTWVDSNNQDGIRPEKITVMLMDGNTEVARTDVTAANGWKYEFKDLPKNKDGKEIEYTIQEVVVMGYETVVEGSNITNIHKPEVVTISGKKIWDDGKDQDGLRPNEITLKLCKNVNGQKDVVKKFTLVGDGDTWFYQFDHLPKNENGIEVKYYIEEEPVYGYETLVDGFVVINSHKPEVMTVSGMKTWEDKDNQFGLRPESIVVRLLKNGVEVASKSISEDENWMYEFNQLPMFEAGEKVVYSIVEDEVEGYETSIHGIDITNTLVKEPVENKEPSKPKEIQTVEQPIVEHEIKTMPSTADGLHIREYVAVLLASIGCIGICLKR